MATPEGKVKAQIKRWLDRRMPGHWRFMPVSLGYGKHGVPDFLVCYQGRMICIEAKAPGGTPTDRQWAQIKQLKAAGAKVYVVDGPEAIERMEASLIRTKGITLWLD